MKDLAEAAWKLRETADNDGLAYVVRPSIPILFFGNYERYFASPVGVVTVGLNPSRKEFPEGDRFARFPAAAGLSKISTDDELATYLEALSNYFRVNPYQAWFDVSFEKVLQGFGASYYEGAENVALHTDFCSPLATDPTWSKLRSVDRETLGTEGKALWHDLVERLEPDVVVMSIRREYLRLIDFELFDQWQTMYSVDTKQDGSPRASPYNVDAARFRLSSGKEVVFIWGKTVNVPFGSVSL